MSNSRNTFAIVWLTNTGAATNLFYTVPSGGEVFRIYHREFIFIYTSRRGPTPAALPLFATGLGALGLLGWRRKRKLSA